MLEWVMPGMAKSKYISTMCWCHHDHFCMAADGGLTNKMSNDFKLFFLLLNQLRTIDRLSAFRKLLNILRVRSNWHAGKNASSHRFVCAPSSLLASHFCLTCPSALVLPSHEHTFTHNLGCGYSSVFCPYCKSDSQTVPCTSLYRAKGGC